MINIRGADSKTKAINIQVIIFSCLSNEVIKFIAFLFLQTLMLGIEFIVILN